MRQGFKIGGHYYMECYDKHGKFKWRERLKNGVTNEGLNDLLGVYFHGDAQDSSWNIGLINNAGFTALAASDTAASHAGWSEFTAYSQATRPAWGEDAQANEQITNTTPADFTITGNGTIKGALLNNDNVKGGAGGKLFCTALFDEGDRAVVATDVLKVTYSVAGQSLS